MSRFEPRTLDKLSASLPLVDFGRLDIRHPALVRVFVDSDTASQMLSLNIKNRRQRRASVEYLKHQIETGEWRDDHPHPIIFSDQGRVIDGQHRLQAISEMGISRGDALVVRVETGAHDDVREYIDTGVPRTLDDRVELVDDHMHNKLIAQICSFETNFRRKTFKKPSPEDAKEFFSAHKDALLFVARNHKRDKGVGRVQIAYAAMEYYEIDPLMAEEFYPAIFIVDSDVQQARVLRDWVLRSMSTAATRENTSGARSEMYYRSIGCMKAHMAGKPITIVRKATW